VVKPVSAGGVVIGKVVHGRVAGEVAVALYLPEASPSPSKGGEINPL